MVEEKVSVRCGACEAEFDVEVRLLRVGDTLNFVCAACARHASSVRSEPPPREE